MEFALACYAESKTVRSFPRAVKQPARYTAASSRIIAAPFSPIMMVGALVLPVVNVGVTDASITHSPLMPRTRRREVNHRDAVILTRAAGADRVGDRRAVMAAMIRQGYRDSYRARARLQRRQARMVSLSRLATTQPAEPATT